MSSIDFTDQILIQKWSFLGILIKSYVLERLQISILLFGSPKPHLYLNWNSVWANILLKVFTNWDVELNKTFGSLS